MATRFTLLGTVEGHADGAALALGGSKQKTVLAMMLLANGRSVSVDNLVEAVWGDDPADGAIATLRVFVSNLRRAVSADAADGIRFDGHGYACKFEYELDVFEFDELCRRAAMAPRGKEAAAWRAALAVFAGDPLGGLEHTEPVRRERVRLSEAKLAATDAFFRAELAAGRHREVLSELFVASAEQPLREQLRSALMVALYRSGRQAEALRAYQEYREGLIAELGIEPSPEMRRLEQMVLDQSPELDAAEQQVVARAPSTIDVRAANISDGRLQLEDGRLVILARRVTVVGREDTADVMVDDRRVSRQHAIIRSRQGRYEIVDDGSTNGTEVNGRPIDRHELRNGDVISLGGFEMTFTQ